MKKSPLNFDVPINTNNGLTNVMSARDWLTDKYGVDQDKVDKMGMPGSNLFKNSFSNEPKLPNDWKDRLLPGENPSAGRARLLKAQKSSAFTGYSPLPGETATTTGNTGASIVGLAAGVSNQSNDVGYNTGANYLEHQGLMSGLTRKGSANSNVRTSTRRIGGTGIGGENYGGYEIGEYQQIRGGMAGRTSRINAERSRFNAMEGLYGDEESRQASIGLGEVPAAFRGGPNENIDDRQNQFNNLLFNPNVKSDQGLNEQYESFYNTQGIV